MSFNHLVLQITDNCPLQCGHCCVESGPWRTTTMAREDAFSYLHQARVMAPEVSLSFTGGEPFVRFPLMLAIAQEAHRLGMWHTTITSAVWCKSREFAREKLAALQESGLRLLNISYDEFHAPWVTPEKIRNCVEAAVELGLRVTITGAITRGSRGATELLGDWPGTLSGVQVGDGWVVPNGRANFIPAEQLFVTDWGEQNLSCPVLNDLVIQPDGSAFPCCSTGGDYTYLRLGDARVTPLAQLRAQLEHSTWFRLITGEGFAGLERIVRHYDPEVVFPRHHLGPCNLCNIVFGSDDLGARVRDALARYDADRARAATSLLGRLAGALAG